MTEIIYDLAALIAEIRSYRDMDPETLDDWADRLTAIQGRVDEEYLYTMDLGRD